MKTSQSKLLCHAAYSIFMALICLSFVTTACSDDGNNAENLPTLKGKITSYNEFGAAMLDFTEEDMTRQASPWATLSASPSTTGKSSCPTTTASTPETENICVWPIPPIPASASQPTTSACPTNSWDWKGIQSSSR